MAIRRPVVFGADGLQQQLQASDTLNVNAFFTGTGNLPTITLLVLNGTSTITVVPKVSGDSLAAGEVITVTPASALPAGLNISYAIVTGTNTVQIGFSAAIAIASSSMAWTVVAHR